MAGSTEAEEFWGIQYATALPPEGPVRRRGALVAGSGVTLAVLAGAASLTYGALAGGGPQPESRVPGDALVYAAVDLDPPAGEKVDLLRLASRFPDVDTSGEDLRRVLLRPALAAGGGDYDRDVAPWLGDRAGVALLPPQPGAVEPEGLLVLRSTDDAAAEEGLRRLREASAAELGWVVRDGWVLVARTQAAAESAAAAADRAPLEGDTEYAGDVARLDDDRVLTVWADLVEVARLGQSAQTPPVDPAAVDPAAPGLEAGLAAGGLEQLGLPPGGLALGRPEDAGRLALGAGAGPDAFEVEMRSIASAAAVPTARGDLLESAGQVPDDSTAVLAVAGHGELVGSEWERLRQDPAAAPWLDLVRDGAAGLGFALPEDLGTLLGQEAVLAVGPVGQGTPAVGLRTSGDAARVQELFARVADSLAGHGIQPAPTKRDTPDGAVLATTPLLADRLAARDGHLGDSERYQAAVPEVDDPYALGYVDLAGIIDGLAATEPEPVPAGLAPLESVGFAAHTDDGDQVARLRLGLR